MLLFSPKCNSILQAQDGKRSLHMQMRYITFGFSFCGDRGYRLWIELPCCLKMSCSLFRYFLIYFFKRKPSSQCFLYKIQLQVYMAETIFFRILKIHLGQWILFLYISLTGISAILWDILHIS